MELYSKRDIVKDINISSLFVCLSLDSKGATEEISASLAINQKEY